LASAWCQAEQSFYTSVKSSIPNEFSSQAGGAATAIGMSFQHPIEYKWCPLWRIDLIHEMVHEWRHKQVSAVSTEARALFEFRQKECDEAGKGHDEMFCQAIVDLAPKLQRSPDQFFCEIMPATLQ
jgi:hypothetical protein